MTMREGLQIRLLGSLEVHHGGRTLPAFPTQKAKSLFSFLVLNRGRLFRREFLAGTFWGDRSETAARQRLRTGIYRVRHTLNALTGTADHIVIQGNEVGFDTSKSYWLDVEAFEGKLKQVELHGPGENRAGRKRLLKEAVDLYRGDLLEGVYDDWCLVEQERLKASYLDALEQLMHVYVEGSEWPRAAAAAKALLGHDPLREHIHRDLMRLHYLAGDRPSAIRQFQRCEEILARELGVTPMRETVEVMRQLQAEEADQIRENTLAFARPPTPPAGHARPESAGPDSPPVADFRRAERHLDRARSSLRSGLHALGKDDA